MSKRIPIKPSRSEAVWEFLNRDVDAVVGLVSAAIGVCGILIVVFTAI